MQDIGLLDVTAARERETHDQRRIGLRGHLEHEVLRVDVLAGIDRIAHLALPLTEKIEIGLVIVGVILDTDGKRLCTLAGKRHFQFFIFKFKYLAFSAGSCFQQRIAIDRSHILGYGKSL